MKIKKVSVQLTGVILKDPSNKGYTGYFSEFPEAIADGSTEEEVTENMFEALNIILETRKMESDDIEEGVKTQYFDLVLA